MEDALMDYAPIVIGTLCRFEHFKEAIESLERNPWVQYTNIYIGVDYPTKEAHWNGYTKIVEYVNTHIFKFMSAKIFIREKNFGSAKNFNNLIAVAFEENEMVICTEDDNVFSPNFLEYIDTMLALYKDSKEIVAICGYSYPIDWNDSKFGYVLNKNFFSAWGWATWKSKWEILQNSITQEYFKNIMCDKARLKKIRLEAPKSYYYLTHMVGKKQISITDVTMSIYMVDHNYYCVMPKLSMVRNCGWDGSGVNCDGKLIYDPQTQKIDERETISPPDIQNIKVNKEDMEKLNILFSVKGVKKMIPYLIEASVRIIGIENYCKLRNYIKKERTTT